MTESFLASMAPRPSRGMSLVEMMIGITLGLVILAGAVIVSTSQLADHRRLLLEAQVQQDLRVTMDLIVRDLRRAGYWAASPQTVNPSSSELTNVLANPYAAVTLANSTADTSIEYSFSRDEEYPDPTYTESGTQDQDERTGFRRISTGGVGVMQMKLNDTWQALTDAAVIDVRSFTVIIETANGADGLPGVVLPCGSNLANCPPRGPGGGALRRCQRSATISITAQAVHDASVKRSIGTTVRLRNDLIREGAC
jgi:type IV pilus assembly protein PilW